MRKGETVLVTDVPSGAPVEILAGLPDFDGKAALGVFREVVPHFDPKKTFVRLNMLRGRDFEPMVLALAKDARPFKKLQGVAASTLQARELRWQKGNLKDSMVGTFGCTLGSDPEIFVLDGKGAVIPAWEFLPGKDKPISGVGLGRGNGGGRVAAYWDGFQAEFSTYADTCLAFHVDSIRDGLKTVYTAAKKHDKDAKLTLQNVVEIPDKVLKSAKDEHVALGCDPSKNIYGTTGLGVRSGRELPMRFAGGHIHIGYKPKDTDELGRMVKAADALVAVSAVSAFAEFDNPFRRQYYGLAGEYRLPPHGVEYRVLSNAWLSHPAIAHLYFDLTREAMRFGSARLLHLLDGAEEARVQDIVNTCDVKAAKELLRKNKEVFQGLCKVIYNGTRGQDHYGAATQKLCAEAAYKVVSEGIESIVGDPNDLEKNWRFKTDWHTHSENKDSQWAKAAKSLSTGKKI